MALMQCMHFTQFESSMVISDPSHSMHLVGQLPQMSRSMFIPFAAAARTSSWSMRILSRQVPMMDMSARAMAATQSFGAAGALES